MGMRLGQELSQTNLSLPSEEINSANMLQDSKFVDGARTIYSSVLKIMDSDPYMKRSVPKEDNLAHFEQVLADSQKFLRDMPQKFDDMKFQGDPADVFAFERAMRLFQDAPKNHILQKMAHELTKGASEVSGTAPLSLMGLSVPGGKINSYRPGKETGIKHSGKRWFGHYGEQQEKRLADRRAKLERREAKRLQKLAD